MTSSRRSRRRSITSCVLGAISVAAVLGSTRAHAQTQPGVSNEMRAETLFRSGEKKFDAGRHAEACQDFEQSLKLAPKLGTLLNVALCHETIGKVATAWREFQHASAWAAQNNQRERHDFAVQHVIALEPRLPRVALQLPVDRAIASLEVDGEPLPEQRWNLPVYLDPGEHAVAVNAPGKRRATVTFRVTLSPTEQIVVVPSLADEPAPAPPSPAPVLQDESPMKRNVGWGLVAAGGIGVVTGAVLAVLSVAKRGDADDHCVDATCDAEGVDLLRSASSLGTGSIVALAAGGVLGAAGGVLLLTSRPPSAPRTGLVLAPRAGVGGIVGLGGTF